MLETDEDMIPYSTLDLAVGEKDAALTVICYDTRINIRATTEDLLGAAAQTTGGICLEFVQFLESIDEEPETMQVFEDWLMRPCLPHLRHLPNENDRRSDKSLPDYYQAPTLSFVLRNVEGRVEALKATDDISEIHNSKPRIPADGAVVSSAIDQGFPCILASQLIVIRDPESSDWEYYGPPTVVRKVDDDSSQFYFKAAVERGSLERELEILLRTGSVCRDVHVTKLVGLVRWDEEEGFIAGMLLEYIPKAKTLDWAADDATAKDRVHWMTELRRSLDRLHAAGIIWGDVKPQNVLIDADGHAWIVDFGGGYSLPWVSQELQGTEEGDLHGLEAIARHLGL